MVGVDRQERVSEDDGYHSAAPDRAELRWFPSGRWSAQVIFLLYCAFDQLF
jgi:hypothetical protein